MTRVAAAVAIAALGLASCAAVELPGLARRCVSYGATVVVSVPAGRILGGSVGCIETAPAPGATSSSP